MLRSVSLNDSGDVFKMSLDCLDLPEVEHLISVQGTGKAMSHFFDGDVYVASEELGKFGNVVLHKSDNKFSYDEIEFLLSKIHKNLKIFDTKTYLRALRTLVSSLKLKNKLLMKKAGEPICYVFVESDEVIFRMLYSEEEIVEKEELLFAVKSAASIDPVFTVRFVKHDNIAILSGYVGHVRDLLLQLSMLLHNTGCIEEQKCFANQLSYLIIQDIAKREQHLLSQFKVLGPGSPMLSHKEVIHKAHGLFEALASDGRIHKLSKEHLGVLYDGVQVPSNSLFALAPPVLMRGFDRIKLRLSDSVLEAIREGKKALGDAI